ncbi:MAG: beta-1,4-galactosyltransferase [Candidatus Aenigmarchaeota archaeon]|nr:beta-1,4-galactosyltransferase [Candidatus Aenigmarchaeota archaeon]
MIFVTVGTDEHSFDRLVKKVDELISSGLIKDEVIIQIGNTKYEPKNPKWFRFETYEKIKELNKSSDLVITHGGAGSIITALMFGKRIIAVPRMKKYNEHVNDHQLELVKQMEKESRVIGVYDIDNLYQAIVKSYKLKQTNSKTKLSGFLSKYLEKLEKHIKR